MAAKNLFGLFCWAAVVAIVIGAWLEIARAQAGTSLVPPRQLRLRLFSAVVWMLALGSLGYALLVLWPAAGDRVAATKFLAVVNGVVCLIFLGFALLVWDMIQFNRQRAAQERRFQGTLEALAKQEIEALEKRTGRRIDPPVEPES